VGDGTESRKDPADSAPEDRAPIVSPLDGEATRSIDGAVNLGELPSRVGSYRILELISERGGMGIVFLAEQETPFRRRVALKMIKPGLDSKEIMARFESERQALAILNHPGIAKIFDAGVSEQGRSYFVMEYVAGLPITDYCDRHRLSTRERIELFTQVCHAIQHAHQKGIIHRDVKPSNILVALRDGKPVVKVIDFGVAKALDQRLTEKTLFTHHGAVIGTPEYMSPEQAEMSGLDIDTTTDIYSLGVVLYELLVGVLPFDSRTLRAAGYAEMQRIIREVEPPHPTTRLTTLGGAAKEIAGRRRVDPDVLRNQLRGDLEWIVLRAMEKDRTRRYLSASELAADIERHLRHEPVAASPPSKMYRLRKAVHRNRATVVAGAAVLLALIAGLATAWVLYVKAESALQQARWQSYVANVQAASAALQIHDAVRAKDALARCPPEFREWEWRYLHSRADASVEVKKWPLRGPVSVGFDTDGHCICVGFDEEAYGVILWDVQTESRVKTLLASDLGYTKDSYASKDNAGLLQCVLDRRCQKMITCVDRGDLHLREYPSGQLIRSLPGPQAECASIVFSDSGQEIAAGFDDGSIRVWSASSGRLLRSFHESDARMTDVAFVPGDRVVSRDYGGNIGVWDVRSGRRVFRLRPPERFEEDPYPGLEGPLLAVSNEADMIAGAGGNNIYVWDGKSGELLGALRGHDRAVRGLSFSPDGRRVVSTGKDGALRVWSTFTFESVASPLGHEGALVGVIAFEPSGERFVTWDWDRSCRFWRAKDERPASLVGAGNLYAPMLSMVSISPDGGHVALAMHRGVIDTRSGLGIPEHLQWSGEQYYTAVAYSENGRTIVAGSRSGSIRVWDAGSGAERLTCAVQDSAVTSLAISPDERRIATADGSRFWAVSGRGMQRGHGTVRCWDASSGRMLYDLGPHECLQRSGVPICFSPDGRLLATGGEEVRVWDAAAGRLRHVLARYRDDEGFCESLSFTPDGKSVLEVSGNGVIQVRDARSGAIQATILGEQGRPVCISPDGSRVFSGSAAGIRIWDRRSGDAIATLSGIGNDPARFLQTDRLAVVGPQSIDAVDPDVPTSGFEADNPAHVNGVSFDQVEKPGRGMGVYLLALRGAREAVRRDPQNWMNLHTLGVALYRLERYEEATQVFAECLRRSPLELSWPVAIALAASYAQLGRAAEARASYDGAIRDFIYTDKLPLELEFLETTRRLLGLKTKAGPG
jgi:WD40 repeat protein/serine/threonine protein kinase